MALPRSAGFALLAPAGKLQLDPSRIFTLSGTLAFNALLFGLLLMPMALPPDALQEVIRHNPAVRLITKPPKPVIVDILPITRPQPTQPNPTPVTTRRVAPAQTPTSTSSNTPISATGNTPATDTTDPTDAIADPGPPIATTPTPVQLGYRNAPAPVYPRLALQRGLSGTVLLQVLVDENGHPLAVTVARSSGYRELDEAARLQVLKRWSFQPALLAGRAVQAMGLVPIEFNLQR
jgi:protein TonB